MTNSRSKIVSALALTAFLFAAAIVGFVAQVSEPSPTPTATASPTPSPTQTPVRTPSPTPFPGAQNFHRWGSITLFNGLPSDSVRAIAQTADGVMWFGTDSGLARFDGRRIQNLSLGSTEANKVLCLLSDDNNFWIGTTNGAYRLTDDGFEIVSGTEGIEITALHSEGDLFVATNLGELFVIIKNENGSFRVEPAFGAPLSEDENLRPLRLTSLTGNRNRLLIGSAGMGLLTAFDGSSTSTYASAQPNHINAMLRDRAGNLFLAGNAPKSSSGLYIYQENNRTEKLAAQTGTVLAIAADWDEGIWCGTDRSGLFHFKERKLVDHFNFENTSGGLRSDTIFTLFTDREGVVWIGTNRGVSRYDPQGPFHENVSDIPNSNFIRTLFHYGQGHDLFAGSNKGLFKFTGEKWEAMAGLGDKTIYSINCPEGYPDAIIVGTPGGILDINGNLIIEGDTRSINDYQGRMYAAIYGRGVVDITNKSRPKVVFAHETVTSIGGYVGKMWIGTADQGLYSFDGINVKHEISSDILKSGTIWRIWQAGHETSLWVAAQHGVFVIKQGAVEQVISVEDARDVWVASPDNDDDVWVATGSRGLIHARRNDLFGWLTASIGFEQGLPSEKAFAILPTKNNFFIATNRGIVDLRSFQIAPKLIPVRVLGQRLHDLTELRSTIDLEYPQNSLLVEVAGQSSRTFPEEFQYAFVIKNSNGEILDKRISNDAQYAPAGLGAGDYTIEAIAFNRDLVASEPMFIRFSVSRAPFPWTATALAALLVLALIGLVWAVIERLRIKTKNRELTAARLDLANEAERERRRIARDLHDQTLADLRKLMMMSDKLPVESASLRSEIETVSSEVRRICEDLSPSVLENVGLTPALEFLLDNTIENSSFSASDHLDERIDLAAEVELQIYRIAQEVLSNIKNHSDADSVGMSIVITNDEEFIMTITDDGTIFRPEGAVFTGRGIANIRARASLIDAHAVWAEGETRGNRFTLTLQNLIAIQGVRQ